MANDELPKKLPVWTSRTAWPQTFEGTNKTYIGGIGSAQDRRPSPRERLVDTLFSIYGDDFEARKQVENIMTYVDASPAAVPLGAYDATRAIGEGRYTDAIIPGITAATPFLSKPAKLVKDAILRRHTAGEIIEDLTNSKPPEPTHNLGETPNGQISSAADPALEQKPLSIQAANGIIDRENPGDIEFTVPKMPWERSSPWVAPHPPASRPPRDFALDYPNGAAADEEGFLERDIEGLPLTSYYTVGRRKAHAKDHVLSPHDINWFLDRHLGATIVRTPENQLIPGTVGQVRTGDNGLPLVKVWDKLPPDQTNTVVAHELGHILDEYAGRVPTEGLDDELNMLYSELATGRSGLPFLLPEMRGYPDHAVPREKMAEAFRAYLTDANMIKTIAPKTAAALRKLNRLPFFSKHLHFNGIPIGLIAGAGATAVMGKGSETQAHQPDADFNMATQDTKSGFRTIAAALKARGSNEPPNQKPISPGLGSIARAIFGRADAYGDPR
jgi:hypothetical protein